MAAAAYARALVATDVDAAQPFPPCKGKRRYNVLRLTPSFFAARLTLPPVACSASRITCSVIDCRSPTGAAFVLGTLAEIAEGRYAGNDSTPISASASCSATSVRRQAQSWRRLPGQL